MDRIERKPPESLVAYDFLLKSLQAFSVITRESDALALRLARRAVELDERYALAHSHIAICLGRRKHTGWMSDEEAETAECVRSAHLAVQLDWDDPNVLTNAAFGLTCLNGDTDTTIAWLDRAIVLNPNSALAYGLGAAVRNFAGDYATAERHAALAMRLSPFDPWTVTFTLELGLSHLLRRNPAEAVAWLRRSAQEPSCGPSTHYSLASACAHLGWLADARASVERLLQISPATTIEGQRRRDLALFKRAEDVEFVLEGARKAGLPE